MTQIWQHRKILAMAAVGGAGLLTMVLAVAAVMLVVTDPVGTADALNARDAGPMISALMSIIWRAFTAMLEYL